MRRYTIDDYINMTVCYENCGNNAVAAANRYRELYPNSNHPCPRTILLAINRRATTGSVDVRREGIDSSSRDRLDVCDIILEYVNQHPEASVRGIAVVLQIPKTTVHVVLKEAGFHPYKKLRVQMFHEGDPEKRLRFCNWILEQEAANEGFASRIIFTDECTFTNNGHSNHHNVHYWAIENPHITDDRRTVQRQFKINAWSGIMANKIIGPYQFEDNLTAVNYTDFIENTLPRLLRDSGINPASRRIWFQQDGAPAHTSVSARQALRGQFPNRVISKWETIEWPPRSPDLNPLDFFLWGHIKDQVYSTRVDNREELMDRINAAMQSVTPEMLERTIKNFLKRCKLCIQINGGHFEQDRRLIEDEDIGDASSTSSDDDPADPLWRAD